MSKLRNKLHEQEGATAVEYGLMVALIAVLIIGAVLTLTRGLDTTFRDTADCLTDAAGCQDDPPAAP